MPRPVTLFTGQWADLSLATLAEMAADWGYDGLELACWGDHFEVDRALEDDAYLPAKRDLLDRHGLTCTAVSTHLVGQCVGQFFKIPGVLTKILQHGRNTSRQTAKFIGSTRAGSDVVSKQPAFGCGCLFGFSLQPSDSVSQSTGKHKDDDRQK